MQFLKISLPLIDQPCLYIDKIVIMQFIHPSQDIQNNLSVILDLLKL